MAVMPQAEPPGRLRSAHMRRERLQPARPEGCSRSQASWAGPTGGEAAGSGVELLQDVDGSDGKGLPLGEVSSGLGPKRRMCLRKP